MKIKTARDLFIARTRGSGESSFLSFFSRPPRSLSLSVRMVEKKKSMNRLVVLATCLTVLLRHCEIKTRDVT